MRPLLLAAALMLVVACRKEAQAPPQPESQAQDQVKGIDRSHKGTPAPDKAFDALGAGPTSLAKMRGQPVLLNLWASWCAPCVKELPTLEALAARDPGLKVVAVSEDMGPPASVEAFLKLQKIKSIGRFHDPKMALSGAVNAPVLPTSVLYDAEGKEVWRYVGELDWTGEEAARLLSEASAGPKS